MILIKRLTLILCNGRIEQVFYPVFPPDKNAEDVIHPFLVRPGLMQMQIALGIPDFIRATLLTPALRSVRRQLSFIFNTKVLSLFSSHSSHRSPSLPEGSDDLLLTCFTR